MESLYSKIHLFSYIMELFSHSFDACFELLDTGYVTFVKMHLFIQGLYSFFLLFDF
jgi:hypothetical protein